MESSFVCLNPHFAIPPLRQLDKNDFKNPRQIYLPPLRPHLEDYRQFNQLTSSSDSEDEIIYIVVKRPKAKRSVRTPFELDISKVPIPVFDDKYLYSEIVPRQAPAKGQPKSQIEQEPLGSSFAGEVSQLDTEETGISRACSMIEEQKSTSPSTKASKKKPQNRIKNIPGLILQRVRTSIKDYLGEAFEPNMMSPRFAYIRKIMDAQSKEFQENFVVFLDSYNKDWKTWKTIDKYIEKDLKNGVVLLEIILEFFGEDGLWDFNEWFTVGKLGPKTKGTISQAKELVFGKFYSLYYKRFGHYANFRGRTVKKEEY